MKNLYIIAIHSVRVDESTNGDYLKNGHNRVEKPAEMARFVSQWKDTPEWEVGQTVEIESYRPLGEGWYGGHSYRKVGMVIHHYQLPGAVVFNQDMPEPTMFEELDEESKKTHNEALDKMVERGLSIEGHSYFREGE